MGLRFCAPDSKGRCHGVRAGPRRHQDACRSPNLRSGPSDSAHWPSSSWPCLFPQPCCRDGRLGWLASLLLARTPRFPLLINRASVDQNAAGSLLFKSMWIEVSNVATLGLQIFDQDRWPSLTLVLLTQFIARWVACSAPFPFHDLYPL